MGIEKFVPQTYRDNLANEIKNEPDRQTKKEILNEAKEDKKYHASKIVHDENRGYDVEQRKKSKEQAVKYKEELREKNDKAIESITTYLDKWHTYLAEFNSNIDKLSEEAKENNTGFLNAVRRGMTASINCLKQTLDFASTNHESLINSNISVRVDEYSNDNFKQPFINPDNGKSYWQTGKQWSSIDYNKAGRIRINFYSRKISEGKIIDIYFPIDVHSIAGHSSANEDANYNHDLEKNEKELNLVKKLFESSQK